MKRRLCKGCGDKEDRGVWGDREDGEIKEYSQFPIPNSQFPIPNNKQPTTNNK